MLKSHGFWRKHEALCWECDPDLALALLREERAFNVKEVKALFRHGD